MKEPLISVIVPVYKVEAYIHECVDSILNQTYARLEVILVDDGSPDSCGAICDAYAEKDGRIKVVHKENGGLVSARKAGLRESSGDYILWVDGDDYLGPGLAAAMVEVVEAHEPEMIAFGFTAVWEDACEPFNNRIQAGLYTGAALEKVKQCLIYDEKSTLRIRYELCTKMVKREILRPWQEAVPEQIRKGEDLAVTAPMMLRSNSIYFLQNNDYFYRQHAASMMHTVRSEEIDLIRLLTDHLEMHMGSAYVGRIRSHELTQLSNYAKGVWEQHQTDRAGFVRAMKSAADRTLRQRFRGIRPCGDGGIKKAFMYRFTKWGWYNMLWFSWRGLEKLRG